MRNMMNAKKRKRDYTTLFRHWSQCDSPVFLRRVHQTSSRLTGGTARSGRWMMTHFVQKQRHCKIITNCTMIYKHLAKEYLLEGLARPLIFSASKSVWIMWQAGAFQSIIRKKRHSHPLFERTNKDERSHRSKVLISRKIGRLMSECESPLKVWNWTGKHRHILHESPVRLNVKRQSIHLKFHQRPS